ncbi:coiled-coil domain-containing protein 69 [Syngnathoides biaculeatus]|uniref:coiled-coil domain-containing protein 69 n=1 Tax=Syngnathoides biaculeatus TaxID=300417 RepID=UPI002ADD8BA7|nr:coiled-coil domain-containing protein 69 [Syngnathoides biaculeatus]
MFPVLEAEALLSVASVNASAVRSGTRFGLQRKFSAVTRRRGRKERRKERRKEGKRKGRERRKEGRRKGREGKKEGRQEGARPAQNKNKKEATDEAGMGCGHSKKKNKKGGGRRDGGERHLRILKDVFSADGGADRAELLKAHADEEACALLLAILDKVKAETSAQLNALHQQRRQQHLRDAERLHREVEVQLTEKFQISEKLLKAEMSELKAELERYGELKRRVQESTFKEDLGRNIQAHGSPGAFWESEQESLLFVIEMKSQLVREQNDKLRRLEQLEEEKARLEQRLAQTLQQNEHLRASAHQNQSVLRRVRSEHEDACASLERQRLFNRMLTQEKEELLFKLRPVDATS